MPSLPEMTETIFTPSGTLAQALPGYEPRPGQVEMAGAVAKALAAGMEREPIPEGGPMAHMLAVEAETGIGKTLAYLIPAALSGARVVVSTATLNLQEQILDKEIPFIRRHIDPDLAAICVKGRRNYACLLRARRFLSAPQSHLFQRRGEHSELLDWLEGTGTGDRAEIPWLPDNSPLWNEMSASSEQCLGAKCPDAAECFITRLRQKAGQARILIVNHHLFFSDLAIRRRGHGEVLPRYQAVIFDEAHHIETTATQYFGESFSQRQVNDLTSDILDLTRLATDGRLDSLAADAQGLAARAAMFTALFPGERGRFPLPDFIDDCPDWDKERERLAASLGHLGDRLRNEAPDDERWDAVARRAAELGRAFEEITSLPDTDHVYWYERRERTLVLSASPISVAPILRDHLYTAAAAIVFTSATLTTGGGFGYFRARLGLDDDIDTLRLPSPFDYKRRTRLFVPADDFPPPNHPRHGEALSRVIGELLALTKGRALVLFTSFQAMNRVHHALDGRLPFPLLRQGDAPRHTLIEVFRRQEHSVLLAVASFWEGVNVPGRSLSCVIIDKLPFEVPTDPVMMARMRHIEEEGGRPFFDFQIPRAVLALRQGVGRLMRAATDHGLLAILDSRLTTKGYGKVFLRSLPPSPVIRTIEEAAAFFSEDTAP